MSSVGSKKVPPSGCRRRRSPRWRRRPTASAMCALAPSRPQPRMISGPCSDAGIESVAHHAAPRSPVRNAATNASWMPFCTMIRLAQTHVCPALRNLEAIAPATAASRSASSNTISGALPPSSRAIFLTVPALWAISSLPTSVEPVKLSARTAGCPVSTSPIISGSPDDDAEHPGRDARAGRPSSARAVADSGVSLRGLDDHRAAGGQRRRGLAQDHRRREVPRRDRGGHPDRLPDGQQPAAGVVGRDDLAVGALAPPRRTTRRTRRRRGSRRAPRPAACPARRSGSSPGRRRSRRSGRTSGEGSAPRSAAVTARPLGRCRPCGRLDRRRDVVAVGARPCVATIAPVAGIDDIGDGARRAGDPLAVDEQLVAKQVAVGQRGDGIEASSPWTAPPSGRSGLWPLCGQLYAKRPADATVSKPAPIERRRSMHATGDR